MFSKLRTSVLGLALAAASPATAQVKLGGNPAVIDSSAVLELASTTKGFLPPRLTQAQMTAIPNPATALTLWCTDCTPPGLRIYDGSSWTTFGTSGVQNATFTSNSLNCLSGTAATGTYQTGVATTSSNTKDIQIGVSAGGAYSISTNTVAGVKFSASGTSNTGGTNTITLLASGTPTAAGTQTFTVTVPGQPSCTFTVTFAGSATFACGSATSTQTPAGALINGTSYSGTYTLPYTAGNGTSYGSVSQTSNGLMLTRTAGTYASGGGNVVYNLSGTYTGTTNGNVTFTLSEGCSVVYGDGMRGALASAGCASCAAYDTAAIGTYVPITKAEYDSLNSKLAGATRVGQTETVMTNANGSTTAWSAYSIDYNNNTNGLTKTIPASNYLVAISYRLGTYATNTNMSGLFMTYVGSTTAGSCDTALGPVVGNYPVSVGRYFLVLKRSSTISPTTTKYFGYFNAAGTPAPVVDGGGITDVYFGGTNSRCPTYSFSSNPLIQSIMTPTKAW